MKKILKVIQLNTNQQKIISKAANGNRDAQRMLYEAYASKMLGVCRYYIKDTHYAEDVMISGFFKVFKYLGSYRKEGSFEGWIRKIMVRECLTFLRSKKELLSYEEDLLMKEDVKNVGAGIECIDAEEIQLMIDELPDGYRTVFLLFAIEGYSHREIAEALDISESTSKSQLFKARRMLQDKVNEFKKKEYGSKSS